MAEEIVEVLLIEDSPDDAAFFKHAFQKTGILARLHVAMDATEAIEFTSATGRFAGHSFVRHLKVIFLDLKLPQTDGLQILKVLKTDPRLWNIPIVVLTSSQEERDLVDSYKLGANSYVVKPMEFDIYSETVRALIHYWLQINQTPKS